MKYANDRTPKQGDHIVGRDHHGNFVAGLVIAITTGGFLRTSANPFPVEPSEAMTAEDAYNLARMVPNLVSEVQDLTSQVVILSAGKPAPATEPTSEPAKSPAAAVAVAVEASTPAPEPMGETVAEFNDRMKAASETGGDIAGKPEPALAVYEPTPAAPDHSHTELDVAAQPAPQAEATAPEGNHPQEGQGTANPS